jgi:TP901 family phage tail tape measure protein
MGKRVVDEDIRFNLIINGNKAQKDLYDLEVATKAVREETKLFKAEQVKLESQNKKGGVAWKNLEAKIKANNRTIRENGTEMRRLQDQIGITGLTLRQLGQKATFLKLQLANMIPNSIDHKRLKAELEAVKARIKEVGFSARTTEGSLSKMANGFNKYQALAFGVFASLTGVVLSMQKVIDINGKLSDSQSDVMKTTQMNKFEVDELTKSFGMLQTRTSRINLLGIAEQGGRIGIAKTEIEDFVRVMNKAAVALGDSFTGGAEEVAEKLGKLKFLFKETKDLGIDEAYNAIGSSINDLGANGNATEGNIADFTTRIGALPDALKPAIANTLALGAAFEESGIESEISARAYSIFVTSAATNTEKFAKVMNLTNAQVQKLINDDPLEFFLKFSKGLQGMDATDISKTLDELGINATGVQKALGAAANNTDRFRELMVLSNDSMQEGTSLLEEYEIKNNNLAATLEKLQKKIIAAFSSETVVKGLTNFVDWFSKLVGASEDADGSVGRFKNGMLALMKAIVLVLATIYSYNAGVKITALLTNKAWQATKLYNIVLKLQYGFLVAQELATKGVALAKSLLTLRVKEVTKAWQAFNLVLKANPLGIILGVITAIVSAYILFSEKTKQAITVQDAFNESQKRAAEATAGTISKLTTLAEVAENVNLKDEDRIKAIKELNKIVPGYNDNLDLTTGALERGKVALDNYVDSLLEQAQAQALLDLVNEKSRELQQAQNASTESYIEWYDKLYDSSRKILSLGISNNEQERKGNERKQERINLLVKEKKAAEDALKAYYSPKAGPTKQGLPNTYPFPFVDTTPGTDTPEEENPFTVPTGESDKETQAFEKAIKERQKLLQDALADSLEARRAAEDARIELIEDNYLREASKLKVAHERKLEDLRNQLIKEDELIELQTNIDSAVVNGKKEEAAALEQIKTAWLQKNAALNKQIEYEDAISVYKNAELVEKGYASQFKDLENKFKREQDLRQTAFNNELAALGDNEQAKKVLRERFDRETLEAQKVFLEESIREMKLMLEQSDFGGFNLELLTEEQKEEIIKRLEELGLSLSEINVLLAKMQGKGDDSFSVLDGDLDILGFSAKQWETTLKNLDLAREKINLAVMSVQAFQQAWQMYNAYVAANENRKLQEFERNEERKRQSLKYRLDRGQVNQRQYDEAVEASEKQVARKRAELEYRQAKREKTQGIIDTIINTSVAIMQGYAQLGPIGGTIAAVLIGTLGALQIATINQQPLPAKGYAKGYGYGTTFPVQREQDGQIFDAEFGGNSRSGFVNKPTVFLAGEQGQYFPELIVSGPDLKRFDPAVTQSLRNELARVKGYEAGYTGPAVRQSTTAPQENEINTALINVLAENTAILKLIKDEGVEAFLSRDMRNTKKLQEDLDKLRDYKNKSLL